MSVLIATTLATLSVMTHSVYPPPVSPVDVAVEKVYFQNGLLRANISWRFDEGINLYLPVIAIFDLLNVVNWFFSIGYFEVFL